MELSYLLSPSFQASDINGKPLTGGYIEVYVYGTSHAKYITFSDFVGNRNPFRIPLNDKGMASIICDASGEYDVYCYNANGVQQWSRERVRCVSVQSIVYEGDKVTVSGVQGHTKVTSSTVGDQTNYEVDIDDEFVEQVDDNTQAITAETERAQNAEAAAKTEVVSGDNIEVTETTAQDGHKVYTVNGVESVPNVEITSPNGTLDISESTDTQTNTKTFEIDVNFPVESYLKRRGIRNQNVAGNLYLLTSTFGSAGSDISVHDDYSLSLKAGIYYFKATVQIDVTSVSNVNTNAYIAAINTGATEFSRSFVNIDNSYLHTETKDISGIFIASSDTRFYIGISELLGNTCGIYNLDIFKIQGSSSGGGGSSDNDKVAVDADAVAGYLEDVLVSASDLVTLVKNGNRLLVNVNTEYSADPKLVTMNESQIDSATDNYGAYGLQDSSVPLAWDDTTYQTYSWLNAMVYQCMRLSDAQGTINKCNVALCGSFGSAPTPCFNVGIFSTNGTLLGQSGLKFKDVDFTTDEELCTVDMVEAFTGSLNIKRNTRYIVMIWTCGLQLAAMDRSTNYNYVYDYTLRQNLQGAVSQPVWPSIDSLNSRASNIPYVAFGATSLN